MLVRQQPVRQRMKLIRQRRFQVIEIEGLSIWKNFNHLSGIDVEENILFRVESHVFVGEEFESKWRLYKFPWQEPIWFSEYLKQFLELWNALKPFRMWKHFRNPLEMVQILFENRYENVEGKNILIASLHSLSTCWRMRRSTACYNFFFLQKSQVFKEFEIMLSTSTVYLLQKFVAQNGEFRRFREVCVDYYYTLGEGAKGG